ncbi:hypothetical protein ACFQX7_39250 [Luedemannella flava]
MSIVVVSGNPRAGSRTSTLAGAVGDAIAERLGLDAPTTIEVGALGAGLMTPGDEPTAAAVAALRGRRSWWSRRRRTRAATPACSRCCSTSCPPTPSPASGPCRS